MSKSIRKARVLLAIALLAVSCITGCQNKSDRYATVEVTKETVSEIHVETPSEATEKTVSEVSVEPSLESSERYAITSQREVRLILPDGTEATTDGGRIVMVLGENDGYYRIKFWNTFATVSKEDIDLLPANFVFDPVRYHSEGIIY